MMIDPVMMEIESRYFSYVVLETGPCIRFIAGGSPKVGKDKMIQGINSFVNRSMHDLSGLTTPLVGKREYPITLEGITDARDDALQKALHAYGLPKDIPIIEEAPHPSMIQPDCIYRFNVVYANILLCLGDGLTRQ